jgi:hypothetical protein
MANYFRITAYNRDEDYSIIIDSYGAFNELWQFSSCLVDKGFSIIAVGNENFFEEGNMPKVKEQTNKMILRAEAKERPVRNGKQITVGDKTYIIA